MAEMKGLYYNNDNIKFVSLEDGIIEGDLTIDGDLTVNGIIELPLKIVTFSDGTDEEIKAMLEAHYAGEINIEDYWHVGDTRVIHLNGTNSGTKIHAAQDMTMIIMDFDHDDLSTAINSKTKAAITVGFRETMGNSADYEAEYYWGSEHYPVEDSDNYSASPLRTWLNDELFNALPKTFSSIIKTVNKKNLVYHTKADNAPLITKDKIWFMSYPEVFGTAKYTYYLDNADPKDYEGTQYEYMKTEANRAKNNNHNGTEHGATHTYWLRSPSSHHHATTYYSWMVVDMNGVANDERGSFYQSIAPAFCL